MAIEQGKQWRRAEWGLRDGKRVRVFEALEPIRCARCRSVIQPGDRFSRTLMSRVHNFRLPFCRGCVPFEAASERG